jgi:hypothetical protein
VDLPLHEGWERVRRGSEDDLAEVRELYQRVAERSSGMLARERGAWRARLTAGSRLYLCPGEGGNLVGYAVVRAGGRRERSTLRVGELLWEDDRAYRALLGWVSAQRDRFAHATHDALPSEPFHRHFAHPPAKGGRRARALWFESARILRGPMLRVLHVGALQARDAGDLLLVGDGDLPENGGSWAGGRRAPADDGAAGGTGGSPLSMEEVARAFLAGSLAGQTPPPAGWSPLLSGDPFRLLDEF